MICFKDQFYYSMYDICFIVDENGTPLAPTRNVEKMLKKVHKNTATIVKDFPLTVQLKYTAPFTNDKPEIALGIDIGSDNIGFSLIDLACKQVLFNSHLRTNNFSVTEHMNERRVHRRCSRRGERYKRIRRAIKFNTVTNKYSSGRIIPGCKKPVFVNYIKNSKTRFSNRKHSRKHWMPPTNIHLIRCYENFINMLTSIAPITAVAIEVNTFDYQKIGMSQTEAYEPTVGPLSGFSSLHELIDYKQAGKCFFCNHAIEEYHHIIPRSYNGSNSPDNIIGVCRSCHEKIHYGTLTLPKTITGSPKYRRGISIQQQIIPVLINFLHNKFSIVRFVDGKETKKYREQFNIIKTHANDAACVVGIAFNIDLHINQSTRCYEFERYRRHDRSKIHAYTDRHYYIYIDAGNNCRNKRRRKNVAFNRHKKFGQINKMSLEEFRNEYGDKAVSQLHVAPGQRSHKNPHRVQRGAIVSYKNDVYIVNGMSNNQYILLQFNDFDKKKTIRANKNKCRLILYNSGYVFRGWHSTNEEVLSR